MFMDLKILKDVENIMVDMTTAELEAVRDYAVKLLDKPRYDAWKKIIIKISDYEQKYGQISLYDYESETEYIINEYNENRPSKIGIKEA